MRSLRLACAALAAVAVLAIPAQASAKLSVGIGENNPAMFSDPLFTAINLKQARIVISWNAIETAAQGDDQIGNLHNYFAAAQNVGVTPLVALEHTRGAVPDCRTKKGKKLAQCKLPSTAAYTKAVTDLLKAFPTLTTISPWNEINHPSQPTVNSPATAAKYTNIVSSVCKQLKRKCTIVVADVLDQANDPSAKRPVFTKTQAYIKAFRKALKPARTVCGIHDYSDVNRFRSTGTKALISALGCKQYWLTETGGIYHFGSSFPASSSRQERATKYMFSLAKSNKRITRLYIFNWFGEETTRFDAGLVLPGSKPRKAYSVVAKAVGKR
jgi:hypothetical protein